jgi:hypothetical protein
MNGGRILGRIPGDGWAAWAGQICQLGSNPENCYESDLPANLFLRSNLTLNGCGEFNSGLHVPNCRLQDRPRPALHNDPVRPPRNTPQLARQA